MSSEQLLLIAAVIYIVHLHVQLRQRRRQAQQLWEMVLRSNPSTSVVLELDKFSHGPR